jgi:hypothetical protein
MVSCYLHQRQRELEFAMGDFPAYLEAMQRRTDGRSALHFLDGCSFIGRFERFEDDWREILKLLQIKKHRKIPRLNYSRPRYDYRNYYDDETAQIVADRHADDILFGEYSFDGSAPVLEPKRQIRP